MTTSASAASAGSPAGDADATALFHEHTRVAAARCDRMFGVLFVLQWIAGMIVAAVMSPRTWAGATSAVHPHVWAAALLGGAIITLPLGLIWFRSGERITRHTIAVAQALTSALLIHVTGGRIETHFHVFGSLAFLAFYRDWKVLVTASVVVAVDHAARGMFWPESVFGIATASQWRWVEHAGWVVFEDIFLIMGCVQGRREMWEIARRHAEAQRVNSIVEQQVQERTAELRAREVELRAARDAAEALSRAKSQFLANMSHEIRTPMTAILGFADMLLQADQNASDRLNHVQVIRRNGQHLLSVINDILDISKIEAGQMTVERIACSPPRIVREVVSLMTVRALEKKLSLEVTFDGPVPDTIQSDPTRLKQILINLIGNAIKFTHRGAVRVAVRLVGSSTDADAALRFQVIDTGIGIDPRQQAALFQPFVQGDESMVRKFGGTGLGLAISKRLAERMGGGIDIASTPGAGTTVTVTVATGPLAGVTMVAEPANSTELLGELPAPGESGVIDSLPAQQRAGKAKPLEGLRILLAEDGIDNQRLIAHMIRGAGAEIEIAEDGVAAYDRAMRAAAEGEPFDCVLMDMQMPLMDGYAATSKLRERGYRGPVIALTAHAMSSDRKKCLSVGCDDYAIKPIDRVTLVAAIRRQVDGKQAEAA